jgi:hypothetical protein
LDTIERLVVREWVAPQHVLVDAFSARAQYQK